MKKDQLLGVSIRLGAIGCFACQGSRIRMGIELSYSFDRFDQRESKTSELKALLGKSGSQAWKSAAWLPASSGVLISSPMMMRKAQSQTAAQAHPGGCLGPGGGYILVVPGLWVL